MDGSWNKYTPTFSLSKNISQINHDFYYYQEIIQK